MMNEEVFADFELVQVHENPAGDAEVVIRDKNNRRVYAGKLPLAPNPGSYYPPGKQKMFPQRSTKEPNAHFQDKLSTSPDKYESVYCGICDTKMNVNRSVVRKVLGSCCSVSHKQYVAAGSPTTKQDEHECPNIHYDWHKKVYDLQLSMRDEASDIIKQIKMDEILSLLEVNQ
jgi:hypothetical protein